MSVTLHCYCIRTATANDNYVTSDLWPIILVAVIRVGVEGGRSERSLDLGGGDTSIALCFL